jgi:uncharacterized protein
MGYPRPVPAVDSDSEGFWEGLKNGQFLLRECVACGHVFFPPRCVCPECWSGELAWKQARGTGTVHSFSVVEAGATRAFAQDTPYVVALVTLVEGCRIFASIAKESSDRISIGASVDCRFVKDPDSPFVFPEFYMTGEKGA